MAGTIALQTPRLLLRRHVPEDAGLLYQNFGTDAAMFRYSGWNPYATPEQARETVRRFIDSYADPRFYGWAIEREGRMVGTIGAYDVDKEKNQIEVRSASASNGPAGARAMPPRRCGPCWNT